MSERYSGACLPSIITYIPSKIAGIVKKPEAGRRGYIPSDQEFVRIINELSRFESQRRWLLISIYTMCRPGAAVDLTLQQYSHEPEHIDLNPPGRRQELGKFRLKVRVPRYLAGWLDLWALQMAHDAKIVGFSGPSSVRAAIRRAREKAALPKFDAYTVRHKMTTALRQVKSRYGIKITEDEIDSQLGRKPNRRAARYGEYDADCLADNARVFDLYAEELHKKYGCPLIAPTMLPQSKTKIAWKFSNLLI